MSAICIDRPVLVARGGPLVPDRELSRGSVLLSAAAGAAGTAGAAAAGICYVQRYWSGAVISPAAAG